MGGVGVVAGGEEELAHQAELDGFQGPFGEWNRCRWVGGWVGWVGGLFCLAYLLLRFSTPTVMGKRRASTTTPEAKGRALVGRRRWRMASPCPKKQQQALTTAASFRSTGAWSSCSWVLGVGGWVGGWVGRWEG